MRWDEIRQCRAQAVEALNDTLNGVRDVGLPYWVCATLMTPVFIGLVAYHGLAMTWALVKVWADLIYKALTAPFLTMGLFIDLCSITFWFMTLVCEKMSGGKK